ncbi:MAG: efflux RND transporter permease subunit, partial [Chitinophagaceae bacterium]
ADVKIEDGPNQIQREDAKRRIIVGFNVKGRDVQSIVHDLQAKVATELHLPSGYYVTYGGAFENLNAAKQRLMLAVPISLLLIFLLLYFAFNSLRQGLLIYSAIPLSAIGGILFLALRGMPFSISAGVGFIALFGVAVLNGIVLIAEFNRIRQEGGEQDLHLVVLQGARVRLRPVLMTAFVASLGFLPMAMSNGAGAEVQRPLATVVIGGLLIATFLTLFVLPILYMTFEKGKSKMNAMSAKAILILIFISSVGWTKAQAQTPITLKASIDTALKYNLSVKAEVLKAKYHQLLIGTGHNLPATSIIAEVGKFNSDYNDTKFAITQSFSLPMVYKRQTNLLKQEAQSSFLNIALAENILEREVTRAYYHIVYLGRKEQLLQSTDSMYHVFLQRAKLRLKTGESNVLEQATAQAQLAQISMELASLKTDQEIAQIQFQLLLNTTEELTPKANDLKMPTTLSIDNTELEKHPYLLQMEQEQKVAAAAVSLERAKLLPEFSLGINNMSIRGQDANGGFNTEADRFNSVQSGINIPLLGGAQRALVQAAKNNETLAEVKYQSGVRTLKAQYEMAWLEYKKLSESVSSLENNSLPSAATIKKVANQQLFSGDINYLEWVMLINQSVAIQNQYLESLNQLNEANIKLQYINTQNK